MIKVSANNEEILTNKVIFSDGAFTYKLDSLPASPRYIWITVDTSTPSCLVREKIEMICSCIENFYGENIENLEVYLSLDYLPYARADRVFEKGNPSPLYDFLVWLDRKRFSKIYINDIHNPKVLEQYKVDNLVEKSQLKCFKDSLSFNHKKDWDIVIAPDKGAIEKATTIAKYLGTTCIYADKERDITTGKILKITLPDCDLLGKKVLIPDDLCDKGGTHMWLASLLREKGAKEVDLYVTHAILPERFVDMENSSINKLIAYQIVGGYINKEDIKNFNSREEK